MQLRHALFAQAWEGETLFILEWGRSGLEGGQVVVAENSSGRLHGWMHGLFIQRISAGELRAGLRAEAGWEPAARTPQPACISSGLETSGSSRWYSRVKVLYISSRVIKRLDSGPWLISLHFCQVISCTLHLYSFIFKLLCFEYFTQQGWDILLMECRCRLNETLNTRGEKSAENLRGTSWGYFFFLKCDQCRRNNPALSETQCCKHRWMMADKH